jgi:hypothetical protein
MRQWTGRFKAFNAAAAAVHAPLTTNAAAAGVHAPLTADTAAARVHAASRGGRLNRDWPACATRVPKRAVLFCSCANLNW